MITDHFLCCFLAETQSFKGTLELQSFDDLFGDIPLHFVQIREALWWLKVSCKVVIHQGSFEAAVLAGCLALDY